MRKKAASGIMLVLLTIGMLSLTFNIQPARSEWTGTVYIRADGSIDPPDAPIITYDNITYTLTGNITSSGDGIVVERDNLIIDGADHTLEGTGAYGSKGIDLSGRTNVTVQNTQIKNFHYGIYLSYSNYNNIVGNKITANNEYGIWLEYSSYNTVSGNNIANNEYGISLYSSSYNTISGNNIANNGDGIYFRYSSNNTITGNDITENNWHGIYLGSGSSNNTICENAFWHDGMSVSGSYGNVVVDNLVNSKPLIYLEDVSDFKVEDAGQVILINCTNITVENLNLSKTNTGIQLWGTNSSTITKNNIRANNIYGIWLGSCSNNTIKGNNITNNLHGIGLGFSSNNTITRNNITKNNDSGIYLGHSSENIITGNNITKNKSDGIWLRYGIHLYHSSYNTVSGNNIANNDVGIYFYYSSKNSIYHNNFVDNTWQLSNDGSVNVWDNGCPSGGNYWSDYNGTDFYRGPYQNETGSDGIGDTPYIIDENNVDRYPLMGPFNSFNASVGYSVDVISNSTIDDFRYFESNGTIVMHLSNMTVDQAFGFCRLTIPHELVLPPYTVKVNGTTVEYETIYENYREGISIIYFAYEHSRLEIAVIPEFPLTTLLLTFLMFLTILIIFTKKTQDQKSLTST